jgi:hypothetical protein
MPEPTQPPNEMVQALTSIAKDLHTIADLMAERYDSSQSPVCRFDYQHAQPNGSHTTA